MKKVTVLNDNTVITEKIEQMKENGWKFVRDEETEDISLLVLIFSK